MFHKSVEIDETRHVYGSQVSLFKLQDVTNAKWQAYWCAVIGELLLRYALRATGRRKCKAASPPQGANGRYGDFSSTRAGKSATFVALQLVQTT